MQDKLGNDLGNLHRDIRKLATGSILEEATKTDLNHRIAALEQTKNDLLEFAKRQLRGEALRSRRVFLPDAVETIKRIVDTEYKESEAAFHAMSLPPLALPLPNAALVLPVVNLLVNATKHHYRKENRRVEMLFDIEEISGSQTLVIDIRDNGPGLDQDTLITLWQAGYSQATDADKRHGIGLWLSRQLVEEAGGSLELKENWRGLGACFRLRYPIHLG